MAAGVTIKHKRKAGACCRRTGRGRDGARYDEFDLVFLDRRRRCSVNRTGILYVTTADVNIPANYAIYFPSEYEVGSGFVTDLADGAILEIG
jgi:hypothetical protein